ncbi:MAG: hypothetical protein RML72_08355 [Bacteroidia bacterium]|nr:hypothetical protein [Bacteroidia bacterium]MDW8158867.1 hypothetical protein [Bacteroidia bacterium]
MTTSRASLKKLLEFLQYFYSSGQKLFWLLWGTLCLSLILLVVVIYTPTFWVSETKPLAVSQAETIILETVRENYREIDLFSKAFSNFIEYSATHFSPNFFLVYVLIFFQIIGYSALLAGSSRLEGILGYVPLLVFCSHLYSSEFVSVFIQNYEYHKWGAFFIMLPFLLFYYFVKTKAFSLNLVQQFGIYGGAILGLYFAVGLVGGNAALYKTATFGYRIHLIIILIFIFFIAKDLLALLVWLITRKNFENPGAAYRIFILSFIAFIALQALLLFVPHYYNFQPLHFFVVAALITVLFSQSAFPILGHIINSQLAYSLIILGTGILATGYIAFHIGNGEFTFRNNVQFLINFVFGVLSLLFGLYIIINFRAALRSNQYFFDSLYEGRVLRFAPVWAVTLVVLIVYDGINLWNTYYSLHCTYKNIQGDYYLLAKDENEARLMYQMATNYKDTDFKANFNLANVLMAFIHPNSDKEEILKVQKHLSKAEENSKAPSLLAILKKGRFFSILGLNKAAKLLYLSKIREMPLSELYCNLASVYFNEGKLDSTEFFLKQGLSHFPEDAILNSNYSSVLLKKGKIKEAISYSHKAFTQQSKEPVVLENYYLFKIVNDSLEVEEVPFRKDSTIGIGFQYNQSLLAYKKGNFLLADSIANWLLNRTQVAEIKFLKLLTCASTNQWKQAIDFYKSLIHQDPDYTPIASHALATLYFKQKTPEMAALYFHKAAQSGWPKDSLFYAYSELDAGNHYKAYDILKVLALDHKDLFELCKREMALLDFAYGNTEFLGWDFSGITPDEALRGGIIGGLVDNPGPALKFYQDLVDTDKKITTPYLEIGRIFRKLNGDESAIKQLELGLKRDPNNVAIHLEIAQSEINLNRLEAAQKRIKQIEAKVKERPEYLFLLAQIAARQKQTEKARKLLEENYRKFIFHKPTILQLFAMYLEQKKYTQGYQFLSEVLDYNSQNPDYWLYYYLFAKQIGMREDAENAQKNMLDLLDNERRKKQYFQFLDSLRTKFKLDS